MRMYLLCMRIYRNPAISFPLGEVEGGFRASAQIIGDLFAEKDLLNIAENVIQN